MSHCRIIIIVRGLYATYVPTDYKSITVIKNTIYDLTIIVLVKIITYYNVMIYAYKIESAV